MDGPSRLSPERRRLATALKGLRIDAGLSGQHLADRLAWSQSKVSKIENGRTRPSIADVEAWAGATHANQRLASELASLAEAMANQAQSWWASHRHGLATRQGEIADIEARATHLQNFQPAVVPGLLQTADYAQRVLSLADISGQRDIAAAVALRLERQTVLYKPAKQFEFVLTEGALRWRPGPPELMLAQLDRLMSLSTMPNIDIRVLSFAEEAPGLYLNGFTIFGVPEESLVLVETLATELTLGDERDLAMYRESFNRLRNAASAGDDARSLLRSIMAELS